MDRISTTNEAMQNAIVTLQQLSNNLESITSKCVLEVAQQLNELNDRFKMETQNYINKITASKDKMKYFINENIYAISERLYKMPDYENKVYDKWNVN